MTKSGSQAIGLLAIFIAILALSESAEGKVAVFVSILPQRYFVQQIGKDLVNIQVMVKPGASPSTYEPKPRQMAADRQDPYLFLYRCAV